MPRLRISTLLVVPALVALTAVGGIVGPAAADPLPVGPVFVDGQAQTVPEFADPDTWIRERLWVETGFDSDGDGRRDRMHVDVTRPKPTADGLKVPVIYETSPYYAGTAGFICSCQVAPQTVGVL